MIIAGMVWAAWETKLYKRLIWTVSVKRGHRDHPFCTTPIFCARRAGIMRCQYADTS